MNQKLQPKVEVNRKTNHSFPERKIEHIVTTLIYKRKKHDIQMTIQQTAFIRLSMFCQFEHRVVMFLSRYVG